MKKSQLLKQASLWSILSITFLSILLIVPLTDNFIDHTKSYLLFFGSILLLFLFILKTLKNKAVQLSVSPISGALFFFGLVAAASTFFTSNYPIEALLGMGGIYLSTTIIAIIAGSLIPKNSITKFLNVLTVSSITLILATVLQMVGFGPAQLINKILGINLPTGMVFNLAGSPFIALQIVALTIVGVITSLVSRDKNNQPLKSKGTKKFFIASLPILLIGFGIFTFSLLPNKQTSLILPPLNTSWSVMLDAIRNPRAALIGVGPSSYSNAYATYKPIWMNNTKQWASIFSQATNFPLTLLSTMGILGLGSWIFLIIKFFKLRKISLRSSKPLICIVATTFLLELFFPVNTVVLTIQAIAIAFLIANEKHRLPLLQFQALNFKVLNKNESDNKLSKPMNLPLYIFVGTTLIGVGALFYFTSKAYYANVVMAQSSKALSDNDLVGAYELQQKAVSINPYSDIFRRRYSSTNAVIAISLSNKADITDAEKKQVSSLLQQSVREARAATTLDQNDFQNWLNLAQIYKNMIGVSEDAAQWTIQSYTTAIERNPNDPTLRIELANIFVSQKKYQQAISILSQAVNLKPDLAGSHYNLAIALEKLDQPEAYRQARISYQRALVLLNAGSEEYTIVNKKIEDLESLMKEKGISLEPESAKKQTSKETGITTPSITEQNIKNNAKKSSGSDINLKPTAQDLNINGDANSSSSTKLTN